MNLIRSGRRPSVQDSLQRTYDEAYQSSVHAIMLETKGDNYNALNIWQSTLGNIGESLTNLQSTPPKSAGEKSLMASILDIERQCTDRIAYLQRDQYERVGHSPSPYLSLPGSHYGNYDRNDNSRSHERPSLPEGYRSSNGISYPSRHGDLIDVESANDSRAKSTPSLESPQFGHGFYPPAPQQQSHHLLEQQQQQNLYQPTETQQQQQQQYKPMVKTLRTAKPGRISDGQKVGAASKAAVLAWDKPRADSLGGSGSMTAQQQQQQHQQQNSPTSSFTQQSSQNGFEKLTMRGKHSGFNKVVNESTKKASGNGRKSPVTKQPPQVNLIDDEVPFIDFDGDFSTPTLDPKVRSRAAATAAASSSTNPATTTNNNAARSRSPLITTTTSTSQKPQPSSSTNNQLKPQTSPQKYVKSTNKPAPPPPAPKPARLSPKPSPQSSSNKPSNNHHHPRPKTAADPPAAAGTSASSGAGGGRSSSSGVPSGGGSGRPTAKPRSQPQQAKPKPKPEKQPIVVGENKNGNNESDKAENGENDSSSEWDKKAKEVLKNLKGIDEAAAKQIINEIVIKGDEVHWDDIAGLEQAKSSLKETVVYPFLRPDLFSGLREPARGMLLFGPPGTGKTMLARAVATESHSTFFSISASSLTSKFLGESEKLVRALFYMARQFAPSIIFVDEIDSLLSSRSDTGEHEASRRIKNEFLVQWSDLQHAAAGKEHDDESVQRVLVLAATNMPWAIDEAARRRFVRRQYIPLPERETRYYQVSRLLSHQKNALTSQDVEKLLDLTEGFSGSDITALAKDAAMGPLRSLGEALLTTPRDSIRPIQIEDFEASLKTIRPSVSREGLKSFEEWASMYGSSGA